jgi:hypothetical protein
MSSCTKRQLGNQKNKLLRYQKIIDLYLEKKTDDISLTVVWRNHINPTFHISKVTLYNILNTPVTKELKEIEVIEAQQISLF